MKRGSSSSEINKNGPTQIKWWVKKLGNEHRTEEEKKITTTKEQIFFKYNTTRSMYEYVRVRYVVGIFVDDAAHRFK